MLDAWVPTQVEQELNNLSAQMTPRHYLCLSVEGQYARDRLLLDAFVPSDRLAVPAQLLVSTMVSLSILSVHFMPSIVVLSFAVIHDLYPSLQNKSAHVDAIRKARQTVHAMDKNKREEAMEV